jgi:hypothetical protein
MLLPPTKLPSSPDPRRQYQSYGKPILFLKLEGGGRYTEEAADIFWEKQSRCGTTNIILTDLEFLVMTIVASRISRLFYRCLTCLLLTAPMMSCHSHHAAHLGIARSLPITPDIPIGITTSWGHGASRSIRRCTPISISFQDGIPFYVRVEAHISTRGP